MSSCLVFQMGTDLGRDHTLTHQGEVSVTLPQAKGIPDCHDIFSDRDIQLRPLRFVRK